MTKILLRLFVRDYKNVNNKRVRSSYGTLSSIVGIIVNFLLSLAKFLVGIVFGSIAISADAINNLSDAGSSLLSLISFKISSKPADREHPFGHARIEYVASMIVSFLIIHIGISLLVDSVKKIIEPQTTEFSMLSIIVLCASILTKLWLYFFNNKMGKAINSQVLRATALDSLSDTVSTSAVLVSVLCLRFFSIDIDAYVGILVSGFILFSGVKILNDTKNSILGEAPSHETVEAIKALVSEYPEAIGIHDMLIHSYGANNTLASFHVEVDGSKDIFKSHDTIDNIERRIREELGIECTIHMDPLITDDERINALHSMTAELISEVDSRMKIHDFRVVEGETHTNLIFDICTPFEITMTNKELTELVSRRINDTDNTLFAVIQIDRE